MKKILSCALATMMLAFCGCSLGEGGKQSGSDSLGNNSSIQESANSIEFVQTELTLAIGESKQTEVVTSKKNVYVFYSVRDKEIVSVSNKGVITALAPGETVVYAEFGGETAMCLVKVKEKSATPELSVSTPYYGNKVSLYANATLDLNAIVKFGDELVTDAALEYEVADAEIASVENGVLKGNALGTTTVTIKATHNGQTATATVSVQIINTVKAVKALMLSGQRTTFKVGDKFVFDGAVSVEYMDGTTENGVDYYTVDTSKYNTAKVGTYEIVVSIGEAKAAYTVTVEKETRTLKLLMIGNSFSQDTVNWLPQIAKSVGFTNVVIGNLVIGGCTLNTHYNNSQGIGDKVNAYEFTYYQNDTWNTLTGQTMMTGIRFTDWDFISLQQQSGNSGNVASYNSDLDGLVKYVKDIATNKNMKLVWNMTWAYPTGSGWFGGLYGNNQMNMYNSIVSAVQEKIVTNDNFCLISPAGTAIQNGRTSYIGDYYPGEGEEFVNTLDEWNRDGAHLSVYEGRFTSSLAMFCTLTGYMPNEITYLPPNIDNKEGEVIRECVTNALVNPFVVTNSKIKN